MHAPLARLLALTLATGCLAGDDAFPLEPLGPYGPTLVQTALGLQRHTEWVSLRTQKVAREAMERHGWKMIGPWVQEPPALRGYLAFRDMDVVVAFRGTRAAERGETARNFAVDAQALVMRKIPFLPEEMTGEARIHAGFRKAYERLRPEIRRRVLQRLERKPGSRVYVTGHSLGGAIATLCAVDLDVLLAGRADVQLVATGCPRVGNREFVTLTEALLPNMLRVMVEGDPVPGVPPGPRYQHAGRLLALAPSGMRLVGDDLARPQTRFDRHKRLVYYQALRDHRGKLPENPTRGRPLQEAARVQDMTRGQRKARKERRARRR